MCSFGHPRGSPDLPALRAAFGPCHMSGRAPSTGRNDPRTPGHGGFRTSQLPCSHHHVSLGQQWHVHISCCPGFEEHLHHSKTCTATATAPQPPRSPRSLPRPPSPGRRNWTRHATRNSRCPSPACQVAAATAAGWVTAKAPEPGGRTVLDPEVTFQRWCSTTTPSLWCVTTMLNWPLI